MPSIKWQVRSDKCDYHSGFLPWTLIFAPASAISPPRGSWWGAWTAASPPSVGNFEPSSRILWGKENRHDESHEEPNGNPPRPKTYGNDDNQNTEYYNCSLKHKPLIVLTITKIRIIFHISNCFADFLHLKRRPSLQPCQKSCSCCSYCRQIKIRLIFNTNSQKLRTNYQKKISE